MTAAPGDKHEFAKISRRVRHAGAVPVAFGQRNGAALVHDAELAVTKSATACERRVTFSLPKMFAR